MSTPLESMIQYLSWTDAAREQSCGSRAHRRRSNWATPGLARRDSTVTSASPLARVHSNTGGDSEQNKARYGTRPNGMPL